MRILVPGLLSRLALCLLILAGGVFTSATGVQAHAALVSTDPAAGAMLEDAPPAFVLTFTEPVSPLVLDLIGGGATPLALTDYRQEGERLVITPPADLPDGAYALSWRVTSLDGHPVAGTLGFSIGVAGQAIAAPQGTSSLVDGLIWAARVAFYLGLFFGVGTLPFHAFIAPAPPLARRASLVALGIGLVAILPGLGLQGLDMLGAPLGALSDPATWSTALGSIYFRTLLIGGLAMGLGIWAWHMRAPRIRAWLVSLAWAGVGVALMASGHASNAPPQDLMRAVVFVHGTMIAAWAGSLLPFLLLMRAGGEAARTMLRRFSVAILPVVALLVIAGVLLAKVQVGHPAALWDTAYGRVLLVKLGLLLVLFLLAALNRFRLTPGYRRDGPGAGRRLARSATAEIALICAILAVVGVWRFTPPPRALAAATAQAAPATAHVHGAKAMADIAITPGRVGTVAVKAYLSHADFAPLVAQEVTLILANADAGVEPMRLPLAPIVDGGWQADGVVLPVAGTWTARLDVLVSDFEMTRLDGTIDIAS